MELLRIIPIHVIFSLLGVDEKTVYPYELILTTGPVGPASIDAIIVNGVESDSLVVENNVLTPLYSGINELFLL